MSEAIERPAAMGAGDERARAVEVLISNLLRIGVGTSLAVVALGTTLSFVHHPDYVSAPPALGRLTRPGAAFPHTVRDVVQGVGQGRGQAIVIVGLLLLIATPVMRVAVSILGFVYEHDWQYVVITSVVLALLLLSFVLGKAGG